MTKGRTPPPLQQLTLSSGITVGIRKVSPFTQDAIRARYKPPRPPMVESDYGDGKKISEPNPADPAYLQSLQEHQLFMAEKFTEAMFALGLEIVVDTGAVTAFRAQMAALDIDMPEDDRQVYIRHLAIRTDDDISLVSNAILRKNTPTEDAIQERLATFSGDVPPASTDGNQPAQVGD